MLIDDARVSSPRVGLFRRRKPNVQRLRREGDIRGLAAALNYREHRPGPDGRPIDMGVGVRLDAALALSEFYGQEVTEALTGALADPNEHVRFAALRGLRVAGSPSGAEPLLHWLVITPDESESRCREEALAALLELPSDHLPEKFAQTLIELTSAPVTPDHPRTLRTLLEADPRGSEAGRAVAESVIDHLEADSPAATERAAVVLECVAAEATSLLIAALSGPAGRRPRGCWARPASRAPLTPWSACWPIRTGRCASRPSEPSAGSGTRVPWSPCCSLRATTTPRSGKRQPTPSTPWG